jgi:homoserine dehydrogenase
MRIILCGFGVVAQSFSKLLESRTHDLYSKVGIKPRIVGVFDSKGCAYDEAGLLSKTPTILGLIPTFE